MVKIPASVSEINNKTAYAVNFGGLQAIVDRYGGLEGFLSPETALIFVVRNVFSNAVRLKDVDRWRTEDGALHCAYEVIWER